MNKHKVKPEIKEQEVLQHFTSLVLHFHFVVQLQRQNCYACAVSAAVSINEMKREL